MSDKVVSSAFGDIETYSDDTCIVCGEVVPNSPIGLVREHEYKNTTAAQFPVYQCPECDLVYLRPRPDISALRQIYPADYYSYHVSMNAPVDGGSQKSLVQGIVYRRGLKRYRKDILAHWQPFSANRPLRVLDIGCSVGAQLDAFKELFPGCETYGVEIDEVAVSKAQARGHQVFFGRFEDTPLPEEHFDIVHASHVIEHVARPDLFLQRCARVLNDSGIIILETPNTDCGEFRLLKRKHWGGYHAPRHWYLFSPKTLQMLSQRLGCQIVFVTPRFIPNYWNWTLHSILKDAVGDRVADILFPPVKIDYGGLQAFVILGAFIVLGRIYLRLSGQGNAIWAVLRKKTADQAISHRRGDE